MVEPKNDSTILKPQNVKAVTTKFDIAKPQKRDSDNHINGKALTINFDRHPKKMDATCKIQDSIHNAQHILEIYLNFRPHFIFRNPSNF